MKKAAYDKAKVRKSAVDNSSARDRVARAKAELLLGPRSSRLTDTVAESMMSSTAHKYYDNDE